ncbi:MAG: hypothetical protein BWY75_02426 [bacterium ADurb.Bin425]|nr:MAG: hypothetical protein BWY75_02426 [bacterium ADurb.Bin425]
MGHGHLRVELEGLGKFLVGGIKLKLQHQSQSHTGDGGGVFGIFVYTLAEGFLRFSVFTS